jgi:hypothetical protein
MALPSAEMGELVVWVPGGPSAAGSDRVRLVLDVCGVFLWSFGRAGSV